MCKRAIVHGHCMDPTVLTLLAVHMRKRVSLIPTLLSFIYSDKTTLCQQINEEDNKKNTSKKHINIYKTTCDTLPRILVYSAETMTSTITNKEHKWNFSKNSR